MNTNELKTEQKIEALARMKMLNLYPNIVKEFDKENIVNMSEHGGMLYWLNDEQKDLISEFEQKYNSIVYHAIHTYTEFGELISLLYVFKYEEEWQQDRDDIVEGYPLVYVINLEDDMCSEFGSIGIKQQFGGLVRTA